MTKATILQAGKLIEDKEDTDKTRLPSRWQLLQMETNINKLPTWEVLRRMFIRHQTVIWAIFCISTWVGIIWTRIYG